MAAGSVISEPSSGTTASPSQANTKAGGKGTSRLMPASRERTASSTGREAATTITTQTNSGSVYWRDSA